MKMTEQEAFEAWANAKCYYLDKREDGHYEKGSTALAWEIAQYFMSVGKAQAVPEGYLVVPDELLNFQANSLAEEEFNQNKALFEMEHRGLSGTYMELTKIKWCQWKAERIKEAYKRFVKLASESGDKK